MATGESNHIDLTDNGFILNQDATQKSPEQEGSFAIWTSEPNTTVDACWFRGGWYDPLSMAWKKIQQGDISAVATVEKDAPGASLYVPFRPSILFSCGRRTARRDHESLSRLTH